MRPVRLLLVLLLFAGPALPAFAQEPDVSAEPEPSEPVDPDAPTPPSEPPPPVYEAQLLRLSEILGSLAFLRSICGSDGNAWREEMSALLRAEQPSAERRKRLIGRFNHGFETFNAVYRSCTPSAERAISRYLSEGQALATDVRSRYSQ